VTRQRSWYEIKAAKNCLLIVGATLFMLGGFKVGVDVLRSVRASESSNSASFTLILPMDWLYVALAGFVLCVLSLYFQKNPSMIKLLNNALSFRKVQGLELGEG